MITLIAALILTSSLFAQTPSSWTQPFPPHRVAENVYFVGSEGLASYLITSPQGHILINSSLEVSVPQIKQSIETLGFRYKGGRSDFQYGKDANSHFLLGRRRARRGPLWWA